MFGKFKTRLSTQRLIDEQLYAQVAVELSDGDIKTGLWTKAIADAEGNENKIKPLYIKYRVQAIKDESRVMNVITDKVRVVKTITQAKEIIEEASSEKETYPQKKAQNEERLNQENGSNTPEDQDNFWIWPMMLFFVLVILSVLSVLVPDF